MQTALATLPSSLSPLAEQTKEYIQNALAANTTKAYRSDWKQFTLWCEAERLPPLPAAPEVVALYLTHLANNGYKAATIERRLVSINFAHTTADLPSPTVTPIVEMTWAGIKRKIYTLQTHKAPAVTDDIRAMVSTLDDSLIGLRDRALLLIGFAGAFRRSELVSLNVEDVETRYEGLVITLRHSKTDQEGQGRTVGIPYGSNPATCPVRALQTWLKMSGIAAGALFRPINRHGQMQSGRLSDKAVALVVKRTAADADLDPRRYAGHSLRAGLATAAAKAKISERSIMNQTGHRSVTMVRRYIREANLFEDNAAAGVGL